MTPSARVQSAIEILDSVIGAAKDNGPPADRILTEWFKTRRFAGSKDRRAIRELVYSAIRACGPPPKSGRAAMIRLAHLDKTIAPLFDGSPYGPTIIGGTEKTAAGGVADRWLQEAFTASGLDKEELPDLLGRAPLDIRINTLKAAGGAPDMPEAGESLAAPGALRFAGNTPVETWAAYTSGLIEIQDHGSQWACAAVGAKAGETIIDLCAGAGGKALALAAHMGNKGAIIASDTDKRRLGNLRPRAERAGAEIITPLLLNPNEELDALEPWIGRADAVLIDAPCSGTGTWRRKPESRWRLTPKVMERYAETQARLIRIGAKLVRPGGRLIFVTCSLLDAEGKRQIEHFLLENPAWQAQDLALPIGRKHGKGMRLTPFHDGTDGFFIASLTRTC